MRNLFRAVGFSLLLLIVAVAAGSERAAAHVLKQDHGISGVLHMPPDDAPVARRPAQISVAFDDARGVFSLANCACQVVLKSSNWEVQTTALRPTLSGSTLNGTATVRFPETGVYDVLIRGRAINGSFLAFQIDYPVRVATAAGGTAAADSGTSVVLIGLGSLVILGLFAYTNIRAGGRYISLPRGTSNSNKVRRSS